MTVHKFASKGTNSNIVTPRLLPQNSEVEPSPRSERLPTDIMMPFINLETKEDAISNAFSRPLTTRNVSRRLNTNHNINSFTSSSGTKFSQSNSRLQSATTNNQTKYSQVNISLRKSIKK